MMKNFRFYGKKVIMSALHWLGMLFQFALIKNQSPVDFRQKCCGLASVISMFTMWLTTKTFLWTGMQDSLA